MLASFREFANSWPAKILLGVLLIGFAVFGIQGGLVPHISNTVIKAGSREISERQFRTIVDNYLAQYQAQGQNATVADFVKAGAQNQLADLLATQEARQAWMAQSGIKPDKSLIVSTLADDPNYKNSGLINPITGQLDTTQLPRVLENAHLTPAEFLQQVTDAISNRQLRTAVDISTRAPRLYAALEAEFFMQTRDVDLIPIDPKSLGAPPTPTDADLQKLYKDHVNDLRRPETRVLTVVLFDPRQVAATVTVDPAEVQKVFDFKKDSLSTPEKRSYVQITAKDAASAKRAADALRSGGSPDAAAKASGGQASTQTDLPKTGVPDQAVGEQAFALKAGQVSDPIQGALGGWTVIKLTGITPGHPASFAEAKGEIENALKQRAAQNKISDMLQKYSEARDAGLSADQAAQKVGAHASDLGPVSKDLRYYGPKDVKLPPQQILTQIIDQGFSLPKGGQTDPKAIGGGQYAGIYMGVAVKDIRGPYTPSFEETKDLVRQQWVNQAMAVRLKAKADEIIARLKKGETTDAVAKSEGLQVKHQPGVPRADLQPNDPRGQLFAAIFGSAKGVPFATAYGPGALVGVVQAIHAPAPALAAAAAAGPARQQASKQLTQDLLDSLQTATRAKIKPTIDKANLNASVDANAAGAPKQ